MLVWLIVDNSVGVEGGFEKEENEEDFLENFVLRLDVLGDYY